MLRIEGRVLIAGAMTALALMLAAMVAPVQFNTIQSAIAGTPAFRSTVEAALAPLPSGCTANPNTNPALRTLAAVKVTRVHRLCQLGRESRQVFLKYTRSNHVKAVWLPRHAKCSEAPNPTWAGHCYYVRQTLRNHFQRLVWVRGAVAKLTIPPVSADPLYGDFLCIHGHEGAWNAVSNSTPTYYGGLQMDTTFQVQYGPEFYRQWGTADHWPAWAQITAALRAYHGWNGPDPRTHSARGFHPWPNTAHDCGLL